MDGKGLNLNDVYKMFKKQGFKNQRDCFHKGVQVGLKIAEEEGKKI